ncbi:hypothetical protein P378_05460 [Desulforamulus profundi]|uniref:Uncharacterized protein n=1 Tax=Desulforamulus profundi TaxID=1383067 RepID=A0A2C6MFY8_9FIRM|nr:hypothetical protein [Desulforamulus profundi]PHJ39108.1 hypothetical protein P378_05460 [Desulforamulus profundi]
MKVVFSLEEEDGSIKKENDLSFDLDASHIMALFNCNEVFYPKKQGSTLFDESQGIWSDSIAGEIKEAYYNLNRAIPELNILIMKK